MPVNTKRQDTWKGIVQRCRYKLCFHPFSSLCQLSRILLFPHLESGGFTYDHYRVDGEIPEKPESSGKQGHGWWYLGYNIKKLTLCCLLWEAWKRNSDTGLKKSAQCTERLGLGSAEMKFCQWIGHRIPCGEPERNDHCPGEGRGGRAWQKGKKGTCDLSALRRDTWRVTFWKVREPDLVLGEQECPESRPAQPS